MEEEMFEALVSTIETQTGKKIKQIFLTEDEAPIDFLMHIPAKESIEDESLEILVYFTDGFKLAARITIEKMYKRLALRVQGNFI